MNNQNYWLNINKPEGDSSAKIVAIVKKITKAKKVGHAGTLDPFATGVLPIAINKATKTCSYLSDADKKYYFEITWGEFRDSDDLTGKIISSSKSRPTNLEIINVLQKFIGEIKQIPSSFSAIKIDGKRSYELARQGKEVELKARKINIRCIKLIFNNQQKAGFEAFCSKGTYIRSLAKDLAKELKVCGYVSTLKRLAVGDFVIKNAISLAKLKNIVKYARPNNFYYRSLSDVLSFIPEIELNNFDATKIRNGQFVEIINNSYQALFSGVVVVKVMNNGNLISLAALQNGWLKPINNF